MHRYQNTALLNTQIEELKKEVNALKRKRRAMFFIAPCGVSLVVLQFSTVAAAILHIVSFSLCFLEVIVRGE